MLRIQAVVDGEVIATVTLSDDKAFHPRHPSWERVWGLLELICKEEVLGGPDEVVRFEAEKAGVPTQLVEDAIAEVNSRGKE